MTVYYAMNNDIQALIDNSQKINSKTISVTRCLILTLLSYFADGLQYRELKNALEISDGKLASNLNRLVTMGYLEKSTVKLERKSLSVYSLTKKGKKEVEKIVEWMKKIQRIGGETTCQI